MAYRLIFTSSARALAGSRTGFCTVARSRDMSEKLAAAVERLGAYDHDTMGDSPIFSHRIAIFANTAYHVLTRVINAPADYTNRSNYIAEHIVLTEDETNLLPSPAQFLADKSDWLKSWVGEPKFLENVEIKQTAQKFAPPAKNWERIFKDPAKAAVLLEQSPTIFANAKDGQELLKLFAESLALLPNKTKAWDYTFTTALQRGENPADFNWKAEINPNSERLFANPKAINLISRTCPEAPDTPAAKYAKTAYMSNRDKFGLKVASPADLKPKIHIANVKKSEGAKSTKIIIIASAVVTILALLIAIFAIFGGKAPEKNSTFKDNEIYTKGADFSAPQTAAQIYATLQGKIKSKIESGDFEGALKLWDDSKIKDFNPYARADILKEIAKKVQTDLQEAQSIIDAQNILGSRMTSSAKSELKAILQRANTALSIANIPQHNEFLKRIKSIEKEIEQL